MNSVREYARPASLEEALVLLARPQPVTRPLGGGTYVALAGTKAEALVDLEGLGLSGISQSGGRLRIGAMTTLQDLSQAAALPSGLRQAAEREAPHNIRQRATLGGTVALGSSGPLLTCLSALNATLTLEPGTRDLPLDAYLATQQAGQPDKGLIVALSFATQRRVAYTEIARTPADAPLMCLSAGAEILAGRLTAVRIACGGADQPLVTGTQVARRFEGLSAEACAEMAAEAAAEWTIAWTTDIRAQASYRRTMQPVLLKRAMVNLQAQG
jgi:aerobic carbon-monoxide dehydrogenase medium subunit